MPVYKIVLAVLSCCVAAACLAISVRHFRGRGTLFNNAYLYATEEERRTMNMRPHYRQSAIVFLLISVIFALNGVALFSSVFVFSVLAVVTAVAAVVYAIVSSIVIHRGEGR